MLPNIRQGLRSQEGQQAQDTSSPGAVAAGGVHQPERGLLHWGEEGGPNRNRPRVHHSGRPGGSSQRSAEHLMPPPSPSAERAVSSPRSHAVWNGFGGSDLASSIGSPPGDQPEDCQCPYYFKDTETRCEQTGATVATVMQHLIAAHIEDNLIDPNQIQVLGCIFRECKDGLVGSRALLDHMKETHQQDLEFVKTLLDKAHDQQTEVAALRAQLASQREKNREKDKINYQLATKMRRSKADSKQEALRQRQAEKHKQKMLRQIKTDYARQQAQVLDLLFKDVVDNVSAPVIDLDDGAGGEEVIEVDSQCGGD